MIDQAIYKKRSNFSGVTKLAPTILVIDDDTEMHNLMRDIFEIHIPKVCLSSAYSSSDGIELINDLHPDLIILDVLLDRQSGINVLEQTPRDIPTLIISGRDNVHMINACYQNGARMFMKKPFEIPALVNFIKDTLHTAMA